MRCGNRRKGKDICAMKSVNRLFYTIFGTAASPEKIIGYCKYHHGCITYGIMEQKECCQKACRHYIQFEWDDVHPTKNVRMTGETYRESLKKKKHRR